MGWKIDGQKPTTPHYVLVAAPHTSNWDGVYLVAMAWRLGIDIHWLGKNTLFKFPFKTVVNWLGGVAVDRSAPNGLVNAVSSRILGAEEFALAVPPEGTRKRGEFWKSGFLHIAKGANVPIVLSYLDYSKKRGGFGPTLSSDMPVDELMEEIREFYSKVLGKFPEHFTPPRLRNEDED
ncbi:MAG: 1-acyl-sn-glycerol-3-phosphate acyltransferase [Myxococcales bacterium]|nr:1-acyl-sn-glycerol-3-phosphate acyltransferase [Myxococcales bacterium]